MKRMKHRIISMIFAIFLAGLVLFVYFDSNQIADPFLADYYLKNFMADTFAQNAVAAIYLNYRMFDSIFETLILLVSVTGVINFSWRRKDD